MSPNGRNGEPAWEDAVCRRYEHPLWKRLAPVAASSGHGGSDYVTLHEFTQAVRHETSNAH